MSAAAHAAVCEQVLNQRVHPARADDDALCVVLPPVASGCGPQFSRSAWLNPCIARSGAEGRARWNARRSPRSSLRSRSSSVRSRTFILLSRRAPPPHVPIIVLKARESAPSSSGHGRIRRRSSSRPRQARTPRPVSSDERPRDGTAHDPDEEGGPRPSTTTPMSTARRRNAAAGARTACCGKSTSTTHGAFSQGVRRRDDRSASGARVFADLSLTQLGGRRGLWRGGHEVRPHVAAVVAYVQRRVPAQQSRKLFTRLLGRHVDAAPPDHVPGGPIPRHHRRNHRESDRVVDEPEAPHGDEVGRGRRTAISASISSWRSSGPGGMPSTGAPVASRMSVRIVFSGLGPPECSTFSAESFDSVPDEVTNFRTALSLTSACVVLPSSLICWSYNCASWSVSERSRWRATSTLAALTVSNDAHEYKNDDDENEPAHHQREFLLNRHPSCGARRVRTHRENLWRKPRPGERCV